MSRQQTFWLRTVWLSESEKEIYLIRCASNKTVSKMCPKGVVHWRWSPPRKSSPPPKKKMRRQQNGGGRKIENKNVSSSVSWKCIDRAHLSKVIWFFFFLNSAPITQTRDSFVWYVFHLLRMRHNMSICKRGNDGKWGLRWIDFSSGKGGPSGDARGKRMEYKM